MVDELMGLSYLGLKGHLLHLLNEPDLANESATTQEI